MTNTKNKQLSVRPQSNETNEQAVARTVIDPATAAAILSVYFPPKGCDLELDALTVAIKTVVEQVQSGDLSDVEAMLVSQAKALQAMFISLSAKAVEQSGMTSYQMLMNMALKSQSQCRTTLQTLLELKFPRTTAFVKQTNITSGPQQVNNGVKSETVDSHAQETETEQTKLSQIEDTSHERETLDFTGAAAAGGTDKEMETLEPVHRTKNKSRKSKSVKKRL